MISLFRINGLPVSVGSIVVLMVFYWKKRRTLAYTAGVFVVIFAAMYGPIYSYLKVKHIPENESVLFSNHIEAHLKAGTTLTPEESKYLNDFAPLDSWGYDCCRVHATMIPIDPEFVHTTLDVPLLKQGPEKPLKIALRLFLKDPSVDLRHMACAGQLVWRVGSSCPDLITNGLFPLSDSEDPVESYKVYYLSFEADSRLPWLIRYANPYLQVFSTGFLHEIIFSPAIYLYVTIFCSTLLAVRKRRWTFMLFLAPALIQSIVLFLINVAPAIRYQYGVVLVGLLSIGFLFVPVEKGNINNVEPRESKESPEK